MYNTVNYADIKIDIKFRNNKTHTIYVNRDVSHEDNSEIVNLDIDSSLSSSSSNPLGGVATNTLDLTLESYDNSLDPECKSSPYYGYMDRTAYIEVYVTKLYIDPFDEESNEADEYPLEEITFDSPVPLGTFYVESWTSNNSADDIFSIQISATDLITSICNMDVPIVRLDPRQNVMAYIKNVIKELNKTLPPSKQIKLSKDTTEVSAYDKNARHRNLATGTKVGELFNQVSQQLLSNIYMNHENTLTFDSLLDDNTQQPVTVFSDNTNLDSISRTSGLLVDYSGVNIQYPVGKTETDKSLASVSDTKFDEVKFNNLALSQRTHNMSYIVVTSSTAICPTVKSLKYDNTKMNLELTKVSGEGTYSLEIYGSTQKDDTDTTNASYTNNDSKDSVITLQNDILAKSKIADYQAKVLQYMKNKRSGISCSVYCDPRICLGDIVTVESTLLGISGKHKVISLHWSLEDSLICNAELMAVTF